MLIPFKVENSICYMGGRKEDNCATPDLLDLANNHLESDRKTVKVQYSLDLIFDQTNNFGPLFRRF